MGLIEQFLIILIMVCIVGVLWFVIVRPIINHYEKKYLKNKNNIISNIVSEDIISIKEELEKDIKETDELQFRKKILEEAVEVADKLVKNKSKVTDLKTQLDIKKGRAGKSGGDESKKTTRKDK